MGIDLTVTWETRCEEVFKRKKGKYAELVEQCQQCGWKCWLFLWKYQQEDLQASPYGEQLVTQESKAGTEENHESSQPSSGKSIQLAVAEEREELEAISKHVVTEPSLETCHLESVLGLKGRNT